MFIDNSSLSLQQDIAGPLDKAGEVPLGLDVLSDAKIIGPFLRHGIDHLLVLWLLSNSRGWSHLLPLSLLSSRHLGWLEERVGFIQSNLLTLSLNTEQMFPTLYSLYRRVVQ